MDARPGFMFYSRSEVARDVRNWRRILREHKTPGPIARQIIRENGLPFAEAKRVRCTGGA